MKKFTNRKVAKDFAESSAVKLDLTPNTYLVFKPGVHPGGVRGQIVRYKKGSTKKWAETSLSDFSPVPLPKDSKIEIDLSTEALQILLDAVEERKTVGVANGSFVVGRESEVLEVKDSNKRNIFASLLEKGYSDEFWQLLQESEPELATRLSVGHLYAEKIATLKELSVRLAKTFSETSGVDSWQSWIYKNNWLFGVNYIRTIDKAKINVSGSTPDYLFLTADYFVDVLEIKLPTEEVILDGPHPSSYRWSAKTNEAIGQVVMYLGEIDRLQLELEREIERVYGVTVSFVKPRGTILIGKKDGWNKFKKAGLRKLNFALHGIEVITYTDLLQRGSEIANMYKEEIPPEEPKLEDIDW